eukprot:g3919.t1
MGNANAGERDVEDDSNIVGKPFVDFEVEALSDSTHARLSVLLNGLPTLLVFVTSWCADCADMVLRCDEMHALYVGRCNIIIVSIDGSRDDAHGGFGPGAGAGVECAHRFWAVGGKPPPQYDVSYVPHRVLLSKAHVVVRNFDMEWEDLHAQV